MNIKRQLIIYSDGGSRGNPGHAAYGYVIYENGQPIHKKGMYLGIQTNNHAEYLGIIEAMRWILTHLNLQDYSDIQCYMDSKLIVEQMNGNWKVKNENIRNLFFTLKSLEAKLSIPITYSHVRRERNTAADALVNEALDAEQF